MIKALKFACGMVEKSPVSGLHTDFELTKPKKKRLDFICLVIGLAFVFEERKKKERKIIENYLKTERVNGVSLDLGTEVIISASDFESLTRGFFFHSSFIFAFLISFLSIILGEEKLVSIKLTNGTIIEKKIPLSCLAPRSVQVFSLSFILFSHSF